jgi:hypothetical protein
LLEIAPVNDELLEERFKNIDTRLDRIEQHLPGLATREELQAAISPLATRDEMLQAITVEGERSRRHATMLSEDTRDDIRLILEHLMALSARVDVLAGR